MATQVDHLKASKSTITSAYANCSDAESKYENWIGDKSGLPTEFEKVNEYFSIAKSNLKYARDYQAWDASSIGIIQSLAASLKKWATMLQTVFSRVAMEVQRDTWNGPMLDSYRDTLLSFGNEGKSHRVEVAMGCLLKALHDLFDKKLLQKDGDDIAQLVAAIRTLANLESSIPDSDFITSGATNTQNIASYGTGYQYNAREQQINAGGGNMTINHVPVHHNDLYFHAHESWMGKSPIHYTPRHMDESNQTHHRNQETSDRVVGDDQLQHRRGQAHSLDSQTVNESNAAGRDRPRGREDFQIAIICALPLEHDVVSLLFDQFWDEDESYGRARGDTNTYTTGRMGQYNVVLVILPNIGTVAAAGAAASFRSSYPNLQLAFVVGICGGVPWNGGNEIQIHLGDVIISKSAVQYDLGKQHHRGFVIKDTVDDSLGRPNKNIRSLVKSFETERIRDQLQQKACLYLKDIQNAATTQKRRRFNYQYPGIANDKLFKATYRHMHRDPKPCNFCNEKTGASCERAAQESCVDVGCDEAKLKSRTDLEMRGSPGEPEIFIGRIASGNMVMKSGEHRDKIAKDQGVIALEMEGAGVWDEIPCIIVKGVCDYADSHKNDVWQRYAAATAASVMKAVLGRYILTDR